MTSRRAYRVFRSELACGLLGEGAGPFITATRSSLPAPRIAVARYTSLSPYEEAAVTGALVAAPDFDAALEALSALGYRLDAAPYAEVFGALEALR